MLFNLAHPKNAALAPDVLNSVTGLWMHQFTWLADTDIGALSPMWNYLVGVDDPAYAELARGAHFTLGIPSLPGYSQLGGMLADEWRAYAGR
jgi:hypothetical protein